MPQQRLCHLLTVLNCWPGRGEQRESRQVSHNDRVDFSKMTDKQFDKRMRESDKAEDEVCVCVCVCGRARVCVCKQFGRGEGDREIERGAGRGGGRARRGRGGRWICVEFIGIYAERCGKSRRMGGLVGFPSII